MGKYINGCCLCCLRRWVENGMKAKFNSEEKLELITIKKTCQERTHLVTSAFFFFLSLKQNYLLRVVSSF